MTTYDANLPIISFAKLQAGDEEEIRRLRDVSHDIGFFYLGDHGVSDELTAQLLQATKDFFAQSPEAKDEISNLKNPYYRGYSFVGDELTQGTVDWREQLDFAAEREPVTEDLDTKPWRLLEGPNPWPSTQPRLKDLVLEWQDKLTDIAQELLRSWAQSLGQPRDFFDHTVEKPFPRLKLIHYPAPDPETGEQSGQGVGAHHDSDVLTLLYNEPGSTGLQVFKDDEWQDVPVQPGHFVVNLGEMLEVATDGYLVATPHRVLPSAPGVSRYSIPYFLAPDLDSTFPQIPLPPELAPQARGRGKDLGGGDIYDSSGLNLLKVKLRAHPETTRRYHQELGEQLVPNAEKSAY